eukprot:TRINITY_DN6651_c0_g1_i2.p1 TRINITY_DN6651_c0_g1~~TRINITY_DN6651_c0_g1_i2.p1  ORF type:complete len:120 (+),score=30.39 TRINITY_DN6651_c0_g1_i2:512-871(+)
MRLMSPSAWLLGCSFTALAAANPVQAQDSGAPQSAGNYADIIVTANKREQNINDVGLSITALSSDALVNRGVASSQDLARVVPALTVAAAADGTPVYTLQIGRAVQQECRDRSRMPSSA